MLVCVSMKILQLNIWGGKLGKQILKLIEKEQPDILCFQEVVKLPAHDTLFFTALKEFEENGEYQSFFSPVFGFNLMNHKAEFGNAILSKIPFIEKETVFTRKEYCDDMDMLDKDYNIRNLQYAKFDSENGPIHILNHHGHHIHEHKNGDPETDRQCQMIANFTKNLSGTIILCGDFNLAPTSSSLTPLHAFLTNQCIEKEVATTRTPLTHKTEVCDYIFTSKSIEVKRFEVLTEIVSDHAALVLEF